MVDLSFSIEGVEAEKFSVTPLVNFALRIVNETPQWRVRNIMLDCQIRFEPARRAYSEEEKERLVELFGAPQRWGETLRSFLWVKASVAAPGFAGETRLRLSAPCTADFGAASAKYFYGLREGVAPLSFLFSGSVFYEDESGALKIEPVPWSKEARFAMPSAVWRDLMEAHWPDGSWLLLRRDTLERLHRHKRREARLTFDDVLASLLDAAERGEIAPERQGDRR
jgi:hypothetical protein